MWIRGRRWLIWMWDTGDRWDSYKLSPFILPSSEHHHVDILYERKGICWWMSATATNSINDHQTYKLIFFLLITKIASINILNCNYVLISDVISSSLKKWSASTRFLIAECYSLTRNQIIIRCASSCSFIVLLTSNRRGTTA